MPVSPLCQVADGLGPFGGTLNGVNITASNTISIKLDDITGVVDWYLQVTGTDETSVAPSLTGVNIMTNKVATPSTVVTFTAPVGAGKAFLFQSTVTGPGGPLTTTFCLYIVTVHGFRVGATGEMRETNATFGWAAILNPLIRSGAPVLRYDDTMVPPLIGAATIQQAIDYLKAASGGSGKPSIVSTLPVEYSTAAVPNFLEAPFRVQQVGLISKVWIFRRYAGTIGVTRVDVLLNGVSIFGAAPNMPQVTALSGDYAYDEKLPALAVVPGDRIEFVLHAVETYSAGPTPQEDGPEGLTMVLEFA